MVSVLGIYYIVEFSSLDFWKFLTNSGYYDNGIDLLLIEIIKMIIWYLGISDDALLLFVIKIIKILSSISNWIIGIHMV